MHTVSCGDDGAHGGAASGRLCVGGRGAWEISALSVFVVNLKLL